MTHDGRVTGGRLFEIGYNRFNRLTLSAIGLGPRFSRVVVDDAHVEIRFGWGFRARIERAAVAGVARSERPFVGWGAHGWRGRWLVNGSSNGIVAIDIDPPARGWAVGFPLRLRTVFVSLADPDGFLGAFPELGASPKTSSERLGAEADARR
jgi:hypothetical protein